ncbi:MAG: hypothetical protein ACK4TA_03615 [Saprospiraceae bacterium]
MKRILFTLVILTLLSNILSAQNKTNQFPKSWIGKWAGALEIYNAKGLVQSVPMQLRILPTDSINRYTQMIIYGEDTIAGKRDYELVVIDEQKGFYATDEKNTIVMESYMLGGKLYNLFEVMNNVLLATTEMVGENLVYEVISTGKQPVSTTGNQKFKGQDIPPVYAYPVNVRQVAVLKRIKE